MRRPPRSRPRPPLDHVARYLAGAGRRAGAPRHQDDDARGARAALEHGRRHADRRPRPAGPTGRRPPPPGVRPGHEPGDRPRARAHRHGPAGGARAPSGLLGGPPRGPRTASPGAPDRGRPRRARSGRCASGGTRVRTLDATWSAADGAGRPRGGPRRGSPARRRRGRRSRASRSSSSPTRRSSIDRLPDPVDPRGRCRPHGPDRCRPARPDGHRRSTPPTSSTSMRWRWSSPSAPRPSTRAWPSNWPPNSPGPVAPRRVTAGRRYRQPRRRLRGRSAQDPRPDGHQRRRVVHRRRARRRRRPRRRRSSRRCFPTAAAWPGRTTFADLAERQLRRRDAAAALPPTAGRPRAAPARPRLRPLPRRWRGAPLLADRSPSEIQVLSGRDDRPRSRRTHRASPSMPRSRATAPRSPAAPTRRPSRATSCASGRRRRRCALDDVEDARSIVRRFVVSAMSVGALSARGPPGAHDRDPARRRFREYRRGRRRPGLVRARRRRPPPRRADQAGRLGPVRRHRHVPRPRRPARDQDLPGLEARRGRPAARSQGHGLHRRAPSRPGRARATSARRRTTTSTRSRTSPSSSRTCARSIRAARIGVKLVAGRGVGTIAAGVAKAGASYIHLSGHAGGTGRLAAVVDQARRGAVGARPRRGPPDAAAQRPARPRRPADRRRPPDRPRPARRRAARGRGVRVRDGGARRDRLRHGPPVPPRHLPDGHRDPARGPACQVHRDARDGRAVLPRPSPRTSAASWPRSAPDPSARSSARAGGACAGAGAARAELAPVVGAPSWGADRPPAAPTRRSPAATVRHAPASPLEARVAAAFRDQGSVTAAGLRLTTADRSFGAGLTGALERGELRGPVRLDAARRRGPVVRGVRRRRASTLRLVGQANDYVGKGLSGGSITIVPEPDLAADPLRRGHRRQHGPVRRDRRPAPPRRPGRDALRGPQQRRGGRRGGHRPARLRVHDRRHGRRPRSGRRELRGRDDRWPGVPVRPERPPRPRSTARSVAATRLVDDRRRTARTARTAPPSSQRLDARPPRRRLGARRRSSSRIRDLASSIWLVEPIAPPVDATDRPVEAGVACRRRNRTATSSCPESDADEPGARRRLPSDARSRRVPLPMPGR